MVKVRQEHIFLKGHHVQVASASRDPISKITGFEQAKVHGRHTVAASVRCSLSLAMRCVSPRKPQCILYQNAAETGGPPHALQAICYK